MTNTIPRQRSETKLSPQHAALIKASAIDPSVAEQRGYRTVDDVLDLSAVGFSLKPGQVPGLLIPLRDLNGEVWGYQYRPDHPRFQPGPAGPDGKRKVRKYEFPAGQRIDLDIPPGARELIRDKSKPIIVTEGVRKADAAVSAGYAAVALLGVTNWRSPDWQLIKLSSRDVYVIFDSDTATNPKVLTQQRKLAALLRDLGAHVGVCTIPPGDDGDKVGLDDYLADDGDLQDLLDEAEFDAGHASAPANPKAVVPEGDGRPGLSVSNDADVFDALRATIGTGRLSGLFLRDNRLVRVRQIGEDGYIAPANPDDDNGPGTIELIDGRKLAALVQICFWTFKVGKDNRPYHASVPGAACDRVVAAALDSPALPRLRGVVHTPIVMRDGTILTEPGYHPKSRLLYLPGDLVVPPVPDKPTRKQVGAARKLLLRMLSGFPFVSDSDRANFLGALLTPLLREAVPEDRPLVVINAPMPGSGKSLLGKILRETHGGVCRSDVLHDNDELRKSVTGVLLTTTGPVVEFDNADGTLRAKSLSKLLTDREWSDRKLGESEERTLVNDRLWVITGNNVKLGRDLPRRALWVNIDANDPHPERRTGFAIPDLEGWVKKNRGEIIAALLTLVRAWVAAGGKKLSHDTPRSDSFGPLARDVAGILTYAGVPGTFWDPSTNRATVGEDDREWGEFLWVLHEIMGDREFQSRDVITALVSSQELHDVLPADLANRYERGRDTGLVRALGHWLANRDGRFAGQIRVVMASRNKQGITRWRIEVREELGTIL